MHLSELKEHIFDTYSVEPDHPFAMDDVSSVYRHSNNRKWFADDAHPVPDAGHLEG